jgi:hypothetical protein
MASSSRVGDAEERPLELESRGPSDAANVGRTGAPETGTKRPTGKREGDDGRREVDEAEASDDDDDDEDEESEEKKDGEKKEG